MGKGRVIKPGQKIHASVAFIQNYEPHAIFSDGIDTGDWLRILMKGRQDTFDWHKEIKDILELDLFYLSGLKIILDDMQKNIHAEHAKGLELWTSTCKCAT
jgi:hypothetical protein